ncbi:MAG: serine--tRNA ligase [Deltaproteobacteria bacterium]|nr:serine--tRNA ligase [Deltaproteobacteria bacterium]
MLDRKFVRENMAEVEQMLANRKTKLDLAELGRLDEQRRELQHKVESLRHEQKQASEKIAQVKKEGGDVKAVIQSVGVISERIKAMEPELKQIDEQYDALLMVVPNMPGPETPVGQSEADNVELRKWGEPRAFDFEVKDHVDVGEGLDILDMPRAAKLSGARFTLLKGDGARLSRALVNFMLETHAKNGYREIAPPFLVNSPTMTGTGQLPKFAEDLFKVDGKDKDLWLIPTAEVPVTNIFRDEILDEGDLPKAMCAFTPCFRSEAGAYGKDTRGMIRVHQFDKVELVWITKPDESEAAHERLTRDAEGILQALNLPYRVMDLCTADIGFSARRCYDLEVWLPSQQAYREISSCSNCWDFQARRAGIRYKSKGQKGTNFAHTLNGSGLAVGRTFLAILENYQNADGTVTIPEALRPYMGGQETIEPPKAEPTVI